MAAGQSFRFMRLRSELKGLLVPAFDRRVTLDRAAKGVAVATGPVFAGIFDRKTEDAVGIARPVEIKAGKTSFAKPALPKKGSDVLVVLRRPAPAMLGSHEVSINLQVNGKALRPDVYLPSASNVFAIWYEVEARDAVLVADAQSSYLPATPLKLQPGKVVTLRTKLSNRPSIGVSIRGPEDALRDTRLALELRDSADGSLVRKLDAAVNADFRFESLSEGKYEVKLFAGDWPLRRRVELAGGDEAQIVFDLSPILVEGIVYYGRDPAPHADVGFDVGPVWLHATTDEAGRYKSLFWEPGEYLAEIKLADPGAAPFLEAGFAIRESTTLDFHVPKTDFAVRVRDAVTGKPVAGASVIATSVYKGQFGEGQTARTVTTDAEGRVALPPARPGAMTIRASAEGYFESAVTRHQVVRADESASFEIALRPAGDVRTVAIRNPDGSPAAGAQVWAVRASGGHDRPLWNGVANEAGVVEVPRAVETSLFLIRPKSAASAVRRLGSDGEVTWSLAPPVPLTVHAGRRTLIAVWIDDVRLSGIPLMLLTGSLEATDDDGNWHAASLPPRAVRVLAWRQLGKPIEGGAFDMAATQLAYPWPRIVELNPID